MSAAIIVWRASIFTVSLAMRAAASDGATQEEALLRMKSSVLWMLHGLATKTTATH
jgi:hypothetical protein